MSLTTINIKKTELKKALCAAKIEGVKVKSIVPFGDSFIADVDFKNGKDLYEMGVKQNTLTGNEYSTDELIAKLSPVQEEKKAK